jgi:hypothetical protein
MTGDEDFHCSAKTTAAPVTAVQLTSKPKTISDVNDSGGGNERQEHRGVRVLFDLRLCDNTMSGLPSVAFVGAGPTTI